jgi:endonuclease G
MIAEIYLTIIIAIGTLHVAAFIMEQTVPRTSPVLNYLTTVDEVEKRAGLDFFWQLPSPDQDTLESVKPLPWVQTWLT